VTNTTMRHADSRLMLSERRRNLAGIMATTLDIALEEGKNR
jgi:hypothetical protein